MQLNEWMSLLDPAGCFTVQPAPPFTVLPIHPKIPPATQIVALGQLIALENVVKPV
jgi:hypothetical protein